MDERFWERQQALGHSGHNSRTNYKHFTEQVKDRFGIDLDLGQCRHLDNLLGTESGREALAARWSRNRPGGKEEWEVDLTSLGYPIKFLILRHGVDDGLITAYPIREARFGPLPENKGRKKKFPHGRRDRKSKIASMQSSTHDWDHEEHFERPIGLARGTFEVSASFHEPLPDDLLDEFSGDTESTS